MKGRVVKLRKLGGTGESEAFGITIPIRIASNYPNTYFHVSEQDGCILLVSGCAPEVNKSGGRTNQIRLDVRQPLY